jgi:hypothetical protein
MSRSLGNGDLDRLLIYRVSHEHLKIEREMKLTCSSAHHNPDAVIAAAHSYHPFSERTCLANRVWEVEMFSLENGVVEDSEACCGCDPVSAKCRPELEKRACIDLCCVTAGEARHDLVHNCRCLLAGSALCLCEEADS